MYLGLYAGIEVNSVSAGLPVTQANIFIVMLKLGWVTVDIKM
jgi:hypothetical protein